MLGTLTSPAGSSIKFSPEISRSGHRMSFLTRKAVICAAAVAEAPPPELESRRATRRPAESLYEVLRVKQDASPREIKTAYRTLAKLYHPDVSAASGSSSSSSSAAAMEAALDGKEFIEIHEAYATLSDPAARARYDLALGASSRARRRVVRHHSPDVRASAGFRTTRRWETDQCW